MRITILIPLVCLAQSAVAQTPGQQYFNWTDLKYPREEYASRRARLVEHLRASGGGVFFAPSGDGVSHGETFRPEADFLYFTGLEFPNSVLTVDARSGQAIVYAPSHDPRYTSESRPNDFPGRPLAADDEIGERAGIAIRSLDALSNALETWANTRTLRVNAGSNELQMPVLRLNHDWSAADGLLAFIRRHHANATIQNAYADVARVRMIKSAREIATMRRAAQITMDAIRHAATLIQPGVDERTLEGELEAAYKRAGSQRTAFSSIVKSGPNSLWPWRVLASHYDRRNRRMEAGDLVIFDVGAELDYYVSDVGRTFPVSGAFTEQQRRILEMEVAVSDAIIAAIRPGVTFADLRRVADAAIPAEHKPYMQAALFFGHHLGLDTGDPNLQDMPLVPGMIFTVEPWYYNHELGVSVFTEDEVLVTESGVEVLTAALPRTPERLERIVRPD